MRCHIGAICMIVYCFALLLHSTVAAKIGPKLAADAQTYSRDSSGINSDRATSKPETPAGATNVLPERNRELFLARMESGQYEEALKQVESLIATMMSSGIDESNPQQRNLLNSLRSDRVAALKQLNRYIEALIEFQRIKLSLPRNDKRLVTINHFMKEHEKKMNEPGEGHYRALQMKTQDNVNTAYRKMMLLLHPDKNGKVDEELAEYIKHLHDLVSKIYQKLSSTSS